MYRRVTENMPDLKAASVYRESRLGLSENVELMDSFSCIHLTRFVVVLIHCSIILCSLINFIL